jgi:hypothetical protein
MCAFDCLILPQIVSRNRHPQLAATTSIQQRSSNDPARSPVRRRDHLDSSPVDPKENVSKQGKVSRHSQTVQPVPCIDTKHYSTTSPILLPHLGC